MGVLRWRIILGVVFLVAIVVFMRFEPEAEFDGGVNKSADGIKGNGQRLGIFHHGGRTMSVDAADGPQRLLTASADGSVRLHDLTADPAQSLMHARLKLSRTRPAAAPGTGRIVARIAAPVVFLVAVIILLSITVQSGVLGGADEPAVTPTPKVTKTKGGGDATAATTRKYVVKSGDTLSGIAVKFGTTESEIQDLNPDMSSSTVVAGDRIIVPLP